MLLFDLSLSANLRQFGIKFRSDQHGKAGPIEPRHQRNASTERSVRFVKVCEMPKVKTEQIRQRKPAAHGKDRARQCGQEALPNIRSKEVQGFHGEYSEPYRYGPMNVRPQQNKQIG